MSDKWIDPEVRLPRWAECVIVARRTYDWDNARHKYRPAGLGVTPAVHWNDGRFTELGSGYVYEDVVGWMPLPKPPAKKKPAKVR